MRATVFISSTYSDLQLDREFVAMAVEEMGFDHQYLPERSIAGTGARAYLAAERRAHIVIYLVSQASSAVDEEIAQARERGMYVIRLAPTSLVEDGRVVSRTAVAEMKGPTFMGTYNNLSQLRDEVRRALSEAVALLADDSRSLTEWSPSSYRDAANAVADSNHRVGLVQDTSSLILGAQRGRLAEEQQFIDNFDAFAERLKGEARPPRRRGSTAPRLDQTVRLIHVYNDGDTRDVVANSQSRKYPYRSERRAMFESLYLPLMERGLAVVVGVQSEVSPVLISDDSCDIGTRVAGRIFFGRFAQFGSSANTLWGALLEVCHGGPPPDLDRLFG